MRHGNLTYASGDDCYNTGSLVYMTHIIDHFTNSFARQQAMQRSPLFQFSMSCSPCILFPRTAVLSFYTVYVRKML
jgi:hypothetical protein